MHGAIQARGPIAPLSALHHLTIRDNSLPDDKPCAFSQDGSDMQVMLPELPENTATIPVQYIDRFLT